GRPRCRRAGRRRNRSSGSSFLLGGGILSRRDDGNGGEVVSIPARVTSEQGQAGYGGVSDDVEVGHGRPPPAALAAANRHLPGGCAFCGAPAPPPRPCPVSFGCPGNT